MRVENSEGQPESNFVVIIMCIDCGRDGRTRHRVLAFVSGSEAQCWRQS